MHRKERNSDDEFQVYRDSAKGYFKMAEECMRTIVPQKFNGYCDVTSILQAEKQSEGLMHYAVAIDTLLNVPAESRTDKDKKNLYLYFSQHAEAYIILGNPLLGAVLKAQAELYNDKKQILQLSQSEDIVTKNQKQQKRERSTEDNAELLAGAGIFPPLKMPRIDRSNSSSSSFSSISLSSPVVGRK